MIRSSGTALSFNDKKMMYEKYTRVYKTKTSISGKNKCIGCYSNCICVVNSIGAGLYGSYKIQDF